MDELQLVIRQQPKKGRMTGFSDDIRKLGPSLIVQLLITRDGQPVTEISDTETEHYLCAVSLIQLETGTRVNVNEDGLDRHGDLRTSNNLIGNWTSSCHHYTDVDGKTGLFFLYPDIGIRSPGKYRFQCDLYKIQLDVRSTEPITTITSQDLKIHSPKNYLKPAVVTKLAKHLKEQGADHRLR